MLRFLLDPDLESQLPPRLLTQDFDFSEDAPGVPHIIERILDLLDGHFATRFVVLGRENDAIGPTPYHLLGLVPFIDYASLVTDDELSLAFHTIGRL